MATGNANTQNINDINGNGLRAVSLSISSAEILTLNTSPLDFIPAFAGYTTQIIAVSGNYTYNTTTYVANDIQLITSGASLQQASLRILTATASTFRNGFITQNSEYLVASTQLFSNTKIIVKVPTANPTVGNGSIIIYAYYRLI